VVLLAAFYFGSFTALCLLASRHIDHGRRSLRSPVGTLRLTSRARGGGSSFQTRRNVQRDQHSVEIFLSGFFKFPRVHQSPGQPDREFGAMSLSLEIKYASKRHGNSTARETSGFQRLRDLPNCSNCVCEST